MADGADSLYVFSLGDSLRIKLPDGSSVRLREIRVRARRPESRLIVGSLWVDVARGSLVRAAYRPSVPMDLWPLMEREIGRDDRSKVEKFGPFTGIVREIIVKHGLYEGRFWLPRTRIAAAEGTAKGARVHSRSNRRSSISASAPYRRARSPSANREYSVSIRGPDAFAIPYGAALSNETQNAGQWAIRRPNGQLIHWCTMTSSV